MKKRLMKKFLKRNLGNGWNDPIMMVIDDWGQPTPMRRETMKEKYREIVFRKRVYNLSRDPKRFYETIEKVFKQFREASKAKKTEIPERFRYPSKPVISEKKEYISSAVRGHRLTKEESDLVAIQDPVDTVDILIEPILTRRALNGFEEGVCVMKKGKEEKNEKK